MIEEWFSRTRQVEKVLEVLVGSVTSPFFQLYSVNILVRLLFKVYHLILSYLNFVANSIFSTKQFQYSVRELGGR